MPSVELISIGTELLLGEIQDTNTQFLARHLRDIGIDLFRSSIVGDNSKRIAQMILESLGRSDIVITTGGLGPTVDDPTREAAALATHQNLLFHPELWEEIKQRFSSRNIVPPDNNRRQAFLPEGAHVIHNPVGTAPAFFLEIGSKIVICLPGVPREMEFLSLNFVFPMLQKKYSLNSLIKARVLHISGLGESAVDERIGEFEKLANPTVGLLAHPGIVDVRITAKADSSEEAGRMILNIENEIVPLFSDDIFGYDEETLVGSVIKLAKANNLRVVVHSQGMSDYWPEEARQAMDATLSINGEISRNSSSPKSSINELIVDCIFSSNESICQLVINTSFLNQSSSQSFIYNGPFQQGPAWAVNVVFDSIRRTIIKINHIERI